MEEEEEHRRKRSTKVDISAGTLSRYFSSIFVISLLCDLDPVMGSSIKIDFEKFDVKGSFFMWKLHVEDLLMQHKLDQALENRSEGIAYQ